ncbi:50S ribosomal protein L3 [Candidatus Microgenomates bacterium]|nr:50S ribosomal protein L3 [Candidatus Microgenomates bacterium]
MVNAILGTKGKMTQAWTEDGHRVSVAIVKASPSVVTQVKTDDKDGYRAIQMGFGIRKDKNTSKPLQGHLNKTQSSNFKSQNYHRYLREVRVEGEEYNLGDEIKASDVLEAGDIVKVQGVSKGKGFAGGVKRWGFHGGPKTHGQSDRHRAPGSIGQGTTPGRVYKGKKMAGRMGGKQATTLNLTVLDVSEDEVRLSGPIPGNPGGLVIIEKTGKDKNFSPLVGKGEEIQPEELPPLEIVESEDESAEEKSDESSENKENTQVAPEGEEK